MNNEEKKAIYNFMAEYNRQRYNNGETDNFIGMLQSKWYQMRLKLKLSIKYSNKYKKKNGKSRSTL